MKQRLELTWYNKDKALIPTETGKYGYSWVDPSDPRYCETHTLIYDDYVQGKQTDKSEEFEYSERADLNPQDDNLLILGESGDVLEALTRVPELVEKYVGKVKLVYIDPPFNTAQTFASYEDNLEHSIWLTMMRDRLLHLKKLLADDGSIWIHLDDVENHRMRMLLDEIFGSGNFLTEIAWRASDNTNNDAKKFSLDHNIIYVYKKSESWVPNKLPRSQEQSSHYRNPDNDPRGPWFDGNPVDSPNFRENLVYTITTPSGNIINPPRLGWRWSQETMDHMFRTGELRFNDTETRVIRRTYLLEQSALPPSSIWSDIKVTGSTRQAKNHLKDMFGLPSKKVFSTPKPERLLERIIHIGSNPGDIVLDVFAGSGTTAAVAHKMGRRWVTCELLESTFNTFTRPRLEKVINDQDPGGITRTKGERIAADDVELPDGVSPDDAAQFTQVLNKLIADDPEAKKNPRIKALKAASKTKRSKEVINWRGGGGFQVAHLSPACFDYDPQLDRVFLTESATGDMLVRSVAANLGFRLLQEDSHVFDGKRGHTLLKVVEGIVTVEQIDALASHLQPKETMTVVATGVVDGVRQHLRQRVKGARILLIPDEIFKLNKGGDQA